MEPQTDDISHWVAAGSKPLLMNAPMSPNRFEDLAASIASKPTSSIVDFGCGQGAFVHRIAELIAATTAPLASQPSQRPPLVGVDTSEKSLAYARALAEDAALSERLVFVCTDAAGWTGVVDSAVCIGSSHAFGDSAEMFARLRTLGATTALIGDGFWDGEPDGWCLENLGEMPRGIDALTALALNAGWEVDSVDVSTLDEWDAFERHWGDGVRAFGTPGALAFAEQRATDYQRYRGVLGFGWLQLSAPN